MVSDRPSAKAADIEALLRDSGAEILMNYLPVGSQKATEFYAQCCLDTGVSLINCIPVFIVSNPAWGQRFRQAGIPCVGDDVKAQVGATIVHRVLTRLMQDRGARIDATYQLNTGGNTDFLNMLNRAAWPPSGSARPRPCSRSSTCRCRPTRCTSAPAISFRGRRTTRSASCGSRAGDSAACR